MEVPAGWSSLFTGSTILLCSVQSLIHSFHRPSHFSPEQQLQRSLVSCLHACFLCPNSFFQFLNSVKLFSTPWPLLMLLSAEKVFPPHLT